MLKNRDWYDRNGDGFSDIPEINAQTLGFRGYYRTGDRSRLSAEYHHIHEFRRGGNLFDRPPHEADIAEQLDHEIDGGGLRFNTFSPNYKHRWEIFASGQGIRRAQLLRRPEKSGCLRPHQRQNLCNRYSIHLHDGPAVVHACGTDRRDRIQLQRPARLLHEPRPRFYAANPCHRRLPCRTSGKPKN